jgi:hypothetical protein
MLRLGQRRGGGKEGQCRDEPCKRLRSGSPHCIGNVNLRCLSGLPQA